MIKIDEKGVFYANGKVLENAGVSKEEGRNNTLSRRILSKHCVNSPNSNLLDIKFDALVSHDITYVNIIQTARASGLKAFPVPYALTNCHNSLCAVGGTINEDDHMFGLSAAKKYGGAYVPAHLAVIHQFARETMAKSGNMILGSDSHTRYGALGTLGIGEGGGEIVKQLLGNAYRIAKPEVVAVVLSGSPSVGVGPHDVALAIIKEVFASGLAKNRILEFAGEGISSLSVDFRSSLDTMTTETTCLSSIWETDEKVREYYRIHGREDDYERLAVDKPAFYDAAVYVDLSKIVPMIALPFHPSNVYKLADVVENPHEILGSVDKNLLSKIVDGRVKADQGVIAGCAGGTFENVSDSVRILGNSSKYCEFPLSIYPASQPILARLIEKGVCSDAVNAGVAVRTAFCGPCFGAGDVPANGALSLRHTTRNFPNREGSKPGEGQSAFVALMDARSIAATAANGGFLTSALENNGVAGEYDYAYNSKIYEKSVYVGYGRPQETELVFGPNIRDWPQFSPLSQHLLLRVASVILDEVTTTDELIPSGETSSFRSNPIKLSEFTLSRKDPGYLARAKEVQKMEETRHETGERAVFDEIGLNLSAEDEKNTMIGSVIFAKKPGDGSAREQAASCQRVLGGLANIANEYATKRYRSNLINWGILPFIGELNFKIGDYLFFSNIRDIVEKGKSEVKCAVFSPNLPTENIKLQLVLSDEERQVLLCGGLINFYGR